MPAVVEGIVVRAVVLLDPHGVKGRRRPLVVVLGLDPLDRTSDRGNADFINDTIQRKAIWIILADHCRFVDAGVVSS